jgi:hypothetical protein
MEEWSSSLVYGLSLSSFASFIGLICECIEASSSNYLLPPTANLQLVRWLSILPSCTNITSPIWIYQCTTF